MPKGRGFLAENRMIQLREIQGDTLAGVIDGVNTDYVCSFDYNPDSVQIYVNGRLKIRDWDDGFWIITPRTIRMKEPLQAGDSLEVEYKANVKTGGGAPGGRPDPPQVITYLPKTGTDEDLPAIASGEIHSKLSSSVENRSTTYADSMKPVMRKPEEV